MFSIISSVLIGFLILFIGSLSRENNFFAIDSEKKQLQIWTNPEHGRLSGIILSKGENSIVMQDFRKKIWMVDLSNILDFSKNVINSEQRIKIIGFTIDENTFIACHVMPFKLSHTSQDLTPRDDSNYYSF